MITNRILILAVATVGLLLHAAAASEEERPAAVADPAKWKELQAGGPVLLTAETDATDDKTKRILAGIVIDAPVETVWAVVCDKEAAPEYVGNLKRAKILKKGRDEDGIEFHLVEQEMKLGLLPGTFVYTCKHRLRPFDRIDFTRTGGDLRDIEGYWKFVPLGGGKKTLLVYQLHLDPGMMIPGAVVRGSLKKSLPEALTGIRDRVAGVLSGKVLLPPAKR